MNRPLVHYHRPLIEPILVTADAAMRDRQQAGPLLAIEVDCEQQPNDHAVTGDNEYYMDYLDHAARSSSGG